MAVRNPSTIARILVAILLAAFYVHAAREHAARVNTFKARADQSGYMFDAIVLYGDWHGQEPQRLVDRNRMPMYGGFLALFYDAGMSNDEFFERAKEWSIWLSLALLVVTYAILRQYLPPLTADNLLLVLAFGIFVFRAAYVQSELLFYFLFFATFVSFARLLASVPGPRTAAVALLAGAVAALAHLTKASVLPLLVVFMLVYAAGALWQRSTRALLWRGVTLAVMLASFTIAVFPYVSNSKRVFGRYFYNVNTTFYVWYDSWPEATAGTRAHGDHEHWPDMPADQLPGPRKYLSEHSSTQIMARIGAGLWKTLEQSYTMFWFMKYACIYLAFGLMLIASRPGASRAVIRKYPALVTFVVLYGVVYLLSIAFYSAISGPERFLLAHVAPMLFSIAWVATRPELRGTTWRVAGASLTEVHFELFVTFTVATDLVFTLWPRLMTTYGGH